MGVVDSPGGHALGVQPGAHRERVQHKPQHFERPALEHHGDESDELDSEDGRTRRGISWRCESERT